MIDGGSEQLAGVMEKLEGWQGGKTEPASEASVEDPLSHTPIDHLLPPLPQQTLRPILENGIFYAPREKDLRDLRSPAFERLQQDPRMEKLLGMYDLTRVLGLQNKNMMGIAINQISVDLPIDTLYTDELLRQTDALLAAAEKIARGEGCEIYTNEKVVFVDTIEQLEKAMLDIQMWTHYLDYLLEEPEKLLIELTRNLADRSIMERGGKIHDGITLIGAEHDPAYVSGLNKRGIRFATREHGSQETQILPVNSVLLGPEDELPTLAQYIDIEKPDQTIIFRFRSLDEFLDRAYVLCKLNEEYRDLPQDKRPKVILESDTFELPLFYRHVYQGFYFTGSMDGVKDTLYLADEIDRFRKDADLAPGSLSPEQRKSYDSSVDLREWEQKTADTYESLKHILGRIAKKKKGVIQRMRSFFSGIEDDIDAPPKLPTTILDVGTGEGRIGGALARLGYNVLGIDISPEMLKRGQERFKLEGEGLRGEVDHPGLSYESLRKLESEGLLPKNGYHNTPDMIILDDEKAKKHYVTMEGSFFNLHIGLNSYLTDWVYNKKVNKDINPRRFFDTGMHPEAFAVPQDMFLDAGFDMVLFNWHTWCEVVGLENQENVLEQILNVMIPGGELVLEIPDRMMPPYIDDLIAYHNAHPDEPFGTHREPKPDGSGEYYPPRYFPGALELVTLLKSKGYEIDLHRDVNSYIVGENDDISGMKKLGLKEYFITARKPK